MPDDKIIPVAPGEFPELDGLKNGAKVSFDGDAELVDGDLKIIAINVSPSDNEATQELSKMTGNDSNSDGSSSGSSSSGF